MTTSEPLSVTFHPGSTDPELNAIEIVRAATSDLTQPERLRVLRYVLDRELEGA